MSRHLACALILPVILLFSICSSVEGQTSPEPSATETAEPAAPESNDLSLTIATRPSGSAQDVFFRIVGDGTSTSIPLYIRQSGKTELVGVRFFAHLSDAQGQQLSGVSFNLTMDGTDVTETGVTIPADERQVLATLHVANLTATGEFTGNLVAESEGKLVEAVVIKGERLPLPVLTVAGASSTGMVNLTSKVTEYRAQLRIESTNLTEVQDLKVVVDDLTDPNGNRIPVTWTVDNQLVDDKKLSVPALSAVELELSAELPTTGGYTGAVTLVYGGKRQTHTLAINRTRPPLGISILGIETARSEADTIVPFIGQDEVSLWLTLHETAGQTATLDLPQLTALSLKGAQENTFQVQFNELEVKLADGTLVTAPFAISPGKPERLLLGIQGLHDAGAYVGKVMLTGPDTTAIEHDITILVKESGWVAAFWIGFGVISSFLIGVWLKSTRPKLQRQRYASRLQNDLAREAMSIDKLTAGKREMTEIVEELRRRLEDIYDTPELGTDASAMSTLNDIDSKISLVRQLVTAYQQVYALEPPKLVGRFLPDLRSIGEQMLLEKVPSAPAAEEKLKKLFIDIENALRDELHQQLQSFGEDVKTQIAETRNPATQEKLKKQILLGIANATDLSQQLELVSAGQVLEQTRVEYARIMADDLVESLQAIPFGFDQKSWSGPKQEIQRKAEAVAQETDDEQAIATYQDAYALYLTRLVEKFLEVNEEAHKLIEAKQSNGTITPEESKDLRETVNSLLAGLHATLKNIQTGSLSSAKQEYQTAKQKYIGAVEPLLNKGGQQMASKGRGSSGAILAAGGLIPERIRGKRQEMPADRRTREQKNLTWAITAGDLVVTGGALFVAIILGLNLLWVGDATWGGFNDCLVALLWGLGVYQVSNQSVQRVDELLNTWGLSNTLAGGQPR